MARSFDGLADDGAEEIMKRIREFEEDRAAHPEAYVDEVSLTQIRSFQKQVRSEIRAAIDSAVMEIRNTIARME